jgi:hypothetical protein
MKKLSWIAAAALVGFCGAALAQVIPVPFIPALGQTDAVMVIPAAVPSAQTKYASPGWIGGLEQYSLQVPVTGFSITIPAHTSVMMINPAGTLATGTFIMEPTPSDGQRVCIVSTQVQTAVTVTANTGQTIGGVAMTAGLATANFQVCFRYIASTATWYRYVGQVT